MAIGTWNNTGEYYIRVSGRNGAFDNQQPFQLDVTRLGGSCGNFVPATLPPSSIPASSGNYKTIILHDAARMEEENGVTDDQLVLRLQTLAQRADVAGVLVDLGEDARINAARQQAETYADCPYATNLWAYEVRDIIQRYWDNNRQLAYVVLVGNDAIIPFFRYPDSAPVSPESDFEPPVLDGSISEANLRLNYVLSQDAYGSRREISLQNRLLPIPNLAVGRLVETTAEAMNTINAYLSTSAGVVNTPTSALVTSYGYLEDGSRAVLQELQDRLPSNSNFSQLIEQYDVPPEASWSADDLRPLLLNQRHDLIYLAGHFNPNRLLAADYSSTISATELKNASVDFTNAIVYSSGCHSGYNIVNDHAVPQVTDAPPDWAQAFAGKGALLIAGTGYQYGDADFKEYSERLYLAFTQRLRVGTGPVSVGQALVAAKQDYLADTGVEVDGIFEKTILVSTLFGLPMLSVDLPNRIAAPTLPTAVTTTNPVSTNTPGATLGLATADVVLSPALTRTVVILIDGETMLPIDTVYYSGPQGQVARPGYPIQPLVITNVTNSAGVVRGAGFRAGTYIDEQNIQPHTSVPATELAGSHPVFYSANFFPRQPWLLNYYDFLARPDSGTIRLMVTPTQFQSNTADASKGTLRRYTNMTFRLFYSPDRSAAALAAPPTIAHVATTTDGGDVHFAVQVNRSSEIADVQEV
ncbi:MAG: hypothetical protein KDE47_32220, partial [Caldilineaceae bacterium]|nr:hypothetical protein [Caldilineaceae bacterium]